MGETASWCVPSRLLHAPPAPLLSGTRTPQGITIESGSDKDEACIRPRVQMLRQGSVGKKTGLMPGDIVTHVDGTPVSTHLEATRLIQSAETVTSPAGCEMIRHPSATPTSTTTPTPTPTPFPPRTWC